MKYFIDTEFIEGKQDKTFLGIKYGETKPTIDLISIRIVSEEYDILQKLKDIFKDKAIKVLRGNIDNGWIIKDGINSKSYYVELTDYEKENYRDIEGKRLDNQDYWIPILRNMFKTISSDWKESNKVVLWINNDEIQKEYYAISKDFNLKAAWKNEWVRENVLGQIYIELLQLGNIFGDERNYWSFTQSNLKTLLSWYGKTNKQIAKEIYNFIYNIQEDSKSDNTGAVRTCTVMNDVEFYGYYSDYDWVVFCQLFGTMMDLPSGFPMYCNDLKQTLDEKVKEYDNDEMTNGDISGLDYYQTHARYPKQTNEHNALADAKWNYELYKFLQTV